LRAERWVEGLRFGECPRWHAGRWWLSDFYDHAVKSIDAAGHVQIEAEVPGQPAGLGWLPDGRLLVVSMTDRRLLRLDGAALVEHADLSGVAPFHCNDLVVDEAGGAWVGHYGFDLERALDERGVPSVVADHPMARLVRVSPDGRVSSSGPALSFPNGLVLDPTGRRLLAAETIAFRITGFCVDGDALTDRRVFAACGDRAPDGICLDAAGGVWFANALAPECVRVDAQGAVTDVVETDARCFGCMLGGEDGRTLLVVGSETDRVDEASVRRVSRVWTARVAVPHAGRP
jgi:sugar lactone lactonase YvrE